MLKLNHRFWLLFTLIVLFKFNLSVGKEKNLDLEEKEDPANSEHDDHFVEDEKLSNNKSFKANRATNYSEQRFSRLFNPRNTGKRLLEVKHNIKPKPTLPSFIRKTPTIRPILFTTVASRNIITQAPNIKSTTAKVQVRSKQKQVPSKINASTTSTTETPKRKFSSNKRNATNRFTSRNRN